MSMTGIFSGQASGKVGFCGTTPCMRENDHLIAFLPQPWGIQKVCSLNLIAAWLTQVVCSADIVKMIESQPDLASQIRRVRGGYLKIQGTWMPYEVFRPAAIHGSAC
jgi:hypothetical protein